MTPVSCAVTLWTGRHSFVSFARTDQIALAAEVSQSFALDNGAFSAWRSGLPLDVGAYSEFVHEWRKHPGFDFCVIPDSIDGTEDENRLLLTGWLRTHRHSMDYSVPVWHMHESLEWLSSLAGAYPRVAIGSSGRWPTPGANDWWSRMAEVMRVVCDDNGYPKTKIHGLRMMNPTIFSNIPFASVDSCQVARNIGIDKKWEAGYLRGMGKTTRAIVLADRMEKHACASRWSGTPTQESFFFSKEVLG